MSFTYAFNWEYFPLFGSKAITKPNAISGNFTVNIFPYWFKQVTLEWFVSSDWGDCRFNIYKSELEDGNFKILNHVPFASNVNFFKDTTSQAYSKINRDWYIIEALHPSGKRIQSKPITWGNKRTSSLADLRSQEIQRREWLLLQKFVGVDTVMFRRKSYGKRCPNCWHPQLEKIIKDHCEVCMGTGFDGGYFEGVSTLIQYDATPNQFSLEYFGKFETNEVSAWTIAFPEVAPRDLIFRATTKSLFSIDAIRGTELQSVVVRQMMKLTELNKSSPEYQLMVKDGLIPVAYQN
jgi:hypothetical protein